MRESDKILATDLRAAGLEDLAVRAENGEWNDYFGRHDLPQVHLIRTLQDVVTIARAKREELIEAAKSGKYDGTYAESEEWSQSKEGRELTRLFHLDLFEPKGGHSGPPPAGRESS